MKISRYKKAQRTIQFYKNNFQFREPFQLLIDATFCQVALQYKINIQDQLPKYLQSQIRLVTTQCIIIEAENLGSALIGATQIVKQFLVHRCGHDKSSISGSACILSMVKNNNYIVATQDREIQDILRLIPGQPLLYLHNRTPVLEVPSDASKKLIQKKLNKSLGFDENDETKLKVLKKIEGLPTPTIKNNKKVKKFKIKQPNPLSCKKKKKSKGAASNKSVDMKRGGITKKIRNKLKISKNVKLNQ